MLGNLQKSIPFQNRRWIRKKFAFNKDLREQIEADFPLAAAQMRKHATKFNRGNRLETAAGLHDFLRKNILYLKDSKDRQIIKLPSRFLKDLYGDCKSYSMFAASVLYNLGYPVNFEYASYDPARPVPSHIYVTTEDEAGNEITLDGTHPHFNVKKNPLIHLSLKT